MNLFVPYLVLLFGLYVSCILNLIELCSVTHVLILGFSAPSLIMLPRFLLELASIIPLRGRFLCLRTPVFFPRNTRTLIKIRVPLVLGVFMV